MRTRTRSAPQKSTTGKALAGLGGLLSKSSGRTNSRGGAGKGKGKAGFALVAGVAGLLFKNREKLTSRFGHKGGAHSDEPALTGATEGKPVAPTVPEDVKPTVKSDHPSEAAVPPAV